MRVIFVGAYSVDEVVLAPIKVGRELFNHLSRKGVNSVYLSYFDDGSKYKRIKKFFGFEKISDRVYRCGILPFILFTIKFKPDLVQIVTPGAYYLLLYPLKSFLKLKVAYLSHSIISYYLKNLLNINCYQKLRLYLIEKIVFKYSDLLQMLSETEAKFVTRYLKVKTNKIRIVDNGINTLGFRKNYNERSELIKIICIGSIIRKEKSFDLLFQAISKIKNPILLSLYDYEEQKNANFELPSNVQINFGKPLNEIELRKEFCKNDLFIIPSRYETFSLSLLEAMETGILFISTDRVGLTSRFPESFNRFLVPYGNAEKLKDKILELHSIDYNEKNNLTDEIKMFASGFNWDDVSEDYVKHYKNLLFK
jgi:glycosyltransferase involved in cell wall biosynthesis